MNEWLFFLHIFLVTATVLGALRLGKTALVSLIVLQGVLANLFVTKQMSLFGLSVTCSDVFAIGEILALNLLQEYFGKDEARQSAKLSLLFLSFFALMSKIHLLYMPIESEASHAAFYAILSSTPRIVGASLITFYLVQKVDIRFFALLKGSLAKRIGISLVVSQALDTVLFSFLGLYGLVESVWSVIAFSFLIKCVVIATCTPFVVFSKKMVRNVSV